MIYRYALVHPPAGSPVCLLSDPLPLDPRKSTREVAEEVRLRIASRGEPLELSEAYFSDEDCAQAVARHERWLQSAGFATERLGSLELLAA